MTMIDLILLETSNLSHYLVFSTLNHVGVSSLFIKKMLNIHMSACN
jgi:hypothetical protein